MKRIKQIIESLKVLSRTPSRAISKAWEEVLTHAESDDILDEHHVLLVDSVMRAVIEMAEEMEHKGAKDGATESESKS